MSALRAAGARLAVAGVFSIAFLWQVLGAVSNLLAWTNFAAILGRQLSSFAWVVLLLGLLIPIVSFVAAVLVARRRAAGPMALVLLAALCASQALGLSQLAFFQAGTGLL